MYKEYNKILCDVLALRDKLGKSVDNRIMPAVIALRISGINTSASCEGHLRRGLPYPWIDIDNPDDRKKLDLFLVDFYAGTKSRNKYRLRTVNFGDHGCRLMSYPSISDNGIKNQKILEACQLEINKFADFLMKNKYE